MPLLLARSPTSVDRGVGMTLDEVLGTREVFGDVVWMGPDGRVALVVGFFGPYPPRD